MKGLAVVPLLTAAFLTLAGGASAETNAQAFQKAHACLVSHGAKEVRAATPYGGGSVVIRKEVASWFYEPHPGMVGRENPQVTSVSVHFSGHKWAAATRAMVVACAKQSLGAGGRLTSVIEE